VNRLGIEKLSVFGLPPVAFVHLAADLGCAHISMGLGYPFSIGSGSTVSSAPVTNPHGYPPFSLVGDLPLRREMKAAMHDRGVAVSLAEGLLVLPGVEARDRASNLDMFAEIGALNVNCVSLDPDVGRTFDQIAVLADMAVERGMTPVLEFAPGLTIADLPTALKVVEHARVPALKLLIDTMHLIRSGSAPTDLDGLDPNLIGYVQIADVPIMPVIEPYMREAMTERLVPGRGELPLLEILNRVPRDRVVSLELPMLSAAEAGIEPGERLRPALEATRALLAQLDAA
jgi:sugar phosphate isomerase/epimerase